MIKPAVKFLRAMRLLCPRCGQGRLFSGWFAMHEACPHCGLDFKREPGFYLGSIYINYGVTALGTGALYALLVFVVGTSHEAALAACLVAAVLFPIWFFRYARSGLLAIDASVNREQPEMFEPPGPSGTGLGAETLAAHRSADASAGCFMGVALMLILLFGLAMAIATILFSAGSMEPEDAEQSTNLPPAAGTRNGN